MDATEVKERASFWGALCKLLLLMPSPEPSPSSAALPEDWQLRAFGPLNAAHQHLDFQLPRTEGVRRLLPKAQIMQALQLCLVEVSWLCMTYCVLAPYVQPNFEGLLPSSYHKCVQSKCTL